MLRFAWKWSSLSVALTVAVIHVALLAEYIRKHRGDITAIMMVGVQRSAEPEFASITYTYPAGMTASSTMPSHSDLLHRPALKSSTVPPDIRESCFLWFHGSLL